MDLRCLAMGGVCAAILASGAHASTLVVARDACGASSAAAPRVIDLSSPLRDPAPAADADARGAVAVFHLVADRGWASQRLFQRFTLAAGADQPRERAACPGVRR